MTPPPTNTLPDDISALKALLLEKDKRISLLEEQVRLLRHKRFAASSEKSDEQAELFNEAEAAGSIPEADLDENTDDAETETIQYERRKSRGRKSLPADLPRVRIEHDLSDVEKVCDCGCALTHIGEDTSEQLDIIPATVQVLVHARLKYACKACESTCMYRRITRTAHSKEQCEPRPTGVYRYREIPRCAAAAPPRSHLQTDGN